MSRFKTATPHGLALLGFAGENVLFTDLNRIAWLVQIKKTEV